MQTVSVVLEKDDLRFYHPETKTWALDEAYTIYAGNDSQAAMNLSCDVAVG